MPKAIFILPLISMFLMPASLNAQLGEGKCQQLVRSYNKRMSEIAKPAPGKTYFVDFELEVNYWSAETTSRKERVKYYISGDQLHMVSSDISTYMNKDYVFTVINSQKKIIVTRNPKDTEGGFESAFNTFVSNQNYVIEQSRLAECSEDPEKGLSKVVLDANDIEVQGLKVDKLTYYFDKKSGGLKKTITTYNRGYEIRRMSITYHDLQTNYKYTFPTDLVAQFLDSKGNLKPKYREYELIAN